MLMAMLILKNVSFEKKKTSSPQKKISLDFFTKRSSKKICRKQKSLKNFIRIEKSLKRFTENKNLLCYLFLSLSLF